MFIKNIKSMYRINDVDIDCGDLVQTIIIVAVFAVIAITVVGLIGNSIMSKGRSVALCIEKPGYSTEHPDDPIECEWPQ